MKKIIYLTIALLTGPISVLATASSPGTSGVATDLNARELTNPLPTTDIRTLIGIVIQRGILSILGAVALIVFVYGGFLWLTAAGNNSKIQQGKTILTWTSIGILIIFLAYVIVRFVFQAIGAA